MLIVMARSCAHGKSERVVEELPEIAEWIGDEVS